MFTKKMVARILLAPKAEDMKAGRATSLVTIKPNDHAHQQAMFTDLLTTVKLHVTHFASVFSYVSVRISRYDL